MIIFFSRFHDRHNLVETLLLNGDAAMTVTRNRDDGFDWSHNCCF
jgi:hypothetical protein